MSDTEELVARGLASIADRLPNDSPRVDVPRYRAVRRRRRLGTVSAGVAVVAVIAGAWTGWARQQAVPPSPPTSPRAFSCPVGTALDGNQVTPSPPGAQPKHAAEDAEHVVLAAGLPGVRIESQPYLATFTLNPQVQLKLFKTTATRLAWLVAYSWADPGVTQEELGKTHGWKLAPRPPSTRHWIAAVDDATLREFPACYPTS
jgi:hypothetical protein